MAKVFIVQKREGVNYSDAARYGELIYVVPVGTPIQANKPRYLVELTRRTMEQGTDQDFLLIDSPNPLLFGIAFAEMDRVADGNIRILRFEKARGGYVEGCVDMNEYSAEAVA